MIKAKERREIAKRAKQRQDELRERYPEVHGKVVDFITHSIDDGTVYFTVRFTDKTSFCLRYACDMFPLALISATGRRATTTSSASTLSRFRGRGDQYQQPRAGTGTV